MMRRFLAAACCAAVLITGAFTFARQVRQQATPQGQSAPAQNPAVPSYVVYRHLFRHIVLLGRQADQEDGQGRDGSSYRSLYKRLAKLSDQQAATLNSVALDCDRAVEQKEEQIKSVIDKARAAYPGGKLEKGQTTPAPPAELKTLQGERQNIIQAAVNRLRASFGEQEFARFDQFVQQNVASNIKPVTMDSLRPALRPGERRQPGLLPSPTPAGR